MMIKTQEDILVNKYTLGKYVKEENPIIMKTETLICRIL